MAFVTSFVRVRCVSARFEAKYIGNYGGRGQFTIGSLKESGRAESIGDVTDDVM